MKAIVNLAENLGMNVIAEGVETSEQMQILRQLVCRDGQGYYFSRPVPANIAEVMLASVNHDSAMELNALTGALARREPIDILVKHAVAM